MKGLLTLSTFLLLNYIKSATTIETFESKDDKITYVQIKPLTESDLNGSFKKYDNHRSSRIENIPLQIRGTPVADAKASPVIELIRAPRQTVKKTKQQTQTTQRPDDVTDYADQGNESEVRFDTSEAVSPEDSIKAAEESTQKISTSQDNDLLKPHYKYGKPKYSNKKYFGSIAGTNPVYRKYIETRQFRSRCRCERISNCPKLQISVPRCPEEYFMCCF